MGADMEARLAQLNARVAQLEGRLSSDDTIGHQLDLAEARLRDLTQKHEGVLMPMDASWVLTCASERNLGLGSCFVSGAGLF